MVVVMWPCWSYRGRTSPRSSASGLGRSRQKPCTAVMTECCVLSRTSQHFVQDGDGFANLFRYLPKHCFKRTLSILLWFLTKQLLSYISTTLYIHLLHCTHIQDEGHNGPPAFCDKKACFR